MGSSGEAMPELREGPPDILNPQTGEYELDPNSTTQPAGWKASIGGIEGMDGFFLQWEIARDPLTYDSVVPPVRRGERLKGFSVLVPTRDDAYVEGHYDANITARLTPMDTAEPTLTVRVSPSTVSKASGATIKVQAILTATDDYDPKPEIKLESITASVPVNPAEIKGAKYGTDDRLFILPVKKDPTGKPVVYTITYSAMDGTGNKATTSATVTLNP